jgi:putative transposase
VGDGALGFWAAAREVWPETREQGCWCHKLANVLDKLPQRLQPRAKRALHEMMYAECRADCEAARARFEAEYQPKYSKAVESLTANWERLVTFFEFPAEHWKHLRQRDRVAVRNRTLARAHDQGRRFQNQRTADGVQAARDGTAALAPPRRRSTVAGGSCRSKVRRWSSGRC